MTDTDRIRFAPERARAAKRLIRYLRTVCTSEEVLVPTCEAEAAAGVSGIDGLLPVATFMEPRLFESDVDRYVNHNGRTCIGARLGLRASDPTWDAYVSAYADDPMAEVRP